MSPKLHGRHLIGLEWTQTGTPHHRAVDAATGAALAPAVADATPAEIDAAMSLALAAHRQAHTVDAFRRAAFLEGIAAAIEAAGDALLERAALETGLAMARLVSERGRTVNQLRAFAELLREGSWVGARLDSAMPERTPPRPDLRRMLVPLGPVVVFGSSNFPLAFSVAGGDTASALAAGCPVIVKAHPGHPGTCELVAAAVAAAVRAADLHPGTFALLHGPSHEVGRRLVEHPATRAVGFTGSLRGGRALVEAAARRPEPIPVFAEMGSVNPVFLLPGAAAARRSALAQGLAASLTMGVGQFCTNPGISLVPTGADGDALVEELAAAVAAVTPGVMLHPGILTSYQEGLRRRSEHEGVKRLTAALAPSDRAETALFEITAARYLAEPELHEEVFGPAGLVVRYQNSEEMLAIARALEGQLTASVHADATDGDLVKELLPLLADRVGRVVWNGFPTGVEVVPAMQHGGPWPASSDSRTTSVGTAAIERFARPVCFQNLPEELLPFELQAANPRGILRVVDGRMTRAPLEK